VTFYPFVRFLLHSKNWILNKKSSISLENDLIREFQRLVDADPDLQWLTDASSLGERPVRRMELMFDGKHVVFKPYYLLNPGFSALEKIADSFKKGALSTPLVILPHINARVLDFCRRHGLSVIDLNGRTFIRTGGLLIDRQALPGRNYRFELEPKDIFVGKSARIIRSLLSHSSKTWVQNDLVATTKASPGLVSRIVSHLIRQGFVKKTGTREFHVSDPLALLDAWAKEDNFSRRTATYRYSVFGGTPFDYARKLDSLFKTRGIPFAFTQWIAGWLRHPYTEPVIVSTYIPELPDDAALEKVGLRTVSEGGKVWLHIPDDEGVFLETQHVQGLPLVSDPQIYLDLLHTGLRGPDQAEALRSWDGFCKK